MSYQEIGFGSLERISREEEIHFAVRRVKRLPKVAKKISKQVLAANLPEEESPLYKSLKDVSEPNSVLNLLQGTLNLLNKIGGEYLSGTPIDTAVFMDKSARNGAYLFLCLWHGLQERDELPPNMCLPRINFVNIGRSNFDNFSGSYGHHMLVRRFLGSKMNILVVDEHVSSGATILTAINMFRQNLKQGCAGIENFQKLPPWYGDDSGILGIKEFTTKGKHDLAKMLNRIDPTLCKDIALILRKLPKDGTLRLFQDICNEKDITNASPLLKIEDQNALKQFLSPLNQYITEESDLIYLYLFLKSTGGYTSLAMAEKEKQKAFNAYRKTLKDIVVTFLRSTD